MISLCIWLVRSALIGKRKLGTTVLGCKIRLLDNFNSLGASRPRGPKMNFILTSVGLTSGNGTNYMHRWSKQEIAPAKVNNIELALHSFDPPRQTGDLAQWHKINNRYSICSSTDNIHIRDSFMSAQKYIFNEGMHIEDHCVAFDEEHACAVMDATANAVWLSSDRIGSIPIWYAMEGSRIMVTTDLLLAYHSGFSEPTALGPGQNMLIDLYRNEIVDLHTRRTHSCVPQEHAKSTEIPEVYSRKVFQNSVAALHQVLSSYIAVPSTTSSQYDNIYTVEEDRIDTSSLLLGCTLDAMEVNRAVRESRPLVTDSSIISQPLFPALVDGVSDSFLKIAQAHVREPSFRSMAIDRWNLCQAASAQDTRVLISHDSGVYPRPVAVYLQNLFCGLLNVTVVYPFRDKALQDAIWSNIQAKSYLHEAVETMRSPRLISGSSSNTGTTTVEPAVYMKAVCDSPSHGTRKWDLSDLIECVGASCVDRIIIHASTPAVGATSEDTTTTPKFSGDVPDKVEFRHHEAEAESLRTGKHGGDLSAPSRRYLPNSLLNIISSVRPHTTADGIIVLLLVTKGYADMLTNFLCAAHTIQFRHFLILTHDREIQDIATQFGVGFYSPHPSSKTPKDADFGTVQYQSLVFSRTELAMELLLSGFQPIIADVDTVWLSNPLAHLPWSHSFGNNSSFSQSQSESAQFAQFAPGAAQDGVMYDVAVTDDNGEVCGCFIALRNTDRAVRFWNEVYVAHRQLIADALNSHNIKAFDESEQKIVTQLIYGGQYKSALSVLQLPAESFPSGYAYFNTQTHRVQGQQPAVVHNNFIVGRELKQARFQRYGMWSTLKPAADRISSNDICENDAALKTSARFFASAHRNISIPSLNMYLPVHGSAVSGRNSVMVHISAEGPVHVRHNGATADFTFPPSQVYVDNNPPAFMDASPAVFAVLNMTANLNHSVLAFTMVTHSEKVALSADVAFYRDYFAIDRAGKLHDRANEVVLRNQRELREGAFALEHTDGTGPVPVPYKSVQKDDIIAINTAGDSAGAEQLGADSAPPQTMSYTIRVITYKRAASLSRLLTSLAGAAYMGYNNISLYISVDRPRNEQDKLAVENVRRIAEAFEWKFGPKTVKVHERNLGLVNQWFNIWQPDSPYEAAFIFEDDMQVSPYFFVWAARAAEKYYRTDSVQIQLQKQMLTAVRDMKDRVASGGNNSSSNQSAMEAYALATAGKPLLYGICLQKQHLDPNHYPRKLLIKNGFRPFLYSLVGSWGPLMLPYAWQAFREWWALRSQQNPRSGAPLTENLVTNYFLSQNPNIWTPWHVRFAYETGAKCLYPNLPGEHALVVNHREQGENYVATTGPDGKLLDLPLLHSLALLPVSTTRPAEPEEGYLLSARPSDSEVLKWALLHLPPMSTVVRFQYDFNLRRAGALGADGTHAPVKRSPSSGGEEVTRAWREVERAVNLSANWQSVSLRGDNYDAGVVSHELSREHWVHVIDMIEAIILPGARFVHFGANPLLALLPALHNGYTQALMLDSARHSVQMWEAALRSAGYSDSSAYFVHKTRLFMHPGDIPVGGFTVVVLDTCVTTGDEMVHQQWTQQLWAALSPVEYLLVLGDCSAAPTDLTVIYGKDKHEVQYVMVEDICSIGGSHDIGAVLYRDVSRLGFPPHRRFTVSRRLAGVLQSRSVVDSEDLV